MKILIVGGGIAGCTLAGLLKKKGFSEITLIEKEPSFTNSGFGINFWGIGRKVLKELDSDLHQIEKDAHYPPEVLLAQEDGVVLASTEIEQFAKYGGHSFIIPRNTLHRFLVNKLNKKTFRLNTHLTSLEQKGNKVEVGFSDGTRDVFDLVVGADGVHSQVRDLVFDSDAVYYPGWTVKLMYLPKGYRYPKSVTYLSRDKHVLALFPMKKKCFVAMYEYDPQRRQKKDYHEVSVFSSYLQKIGWSEKQIAQLEWAEKQRTSLAYVSLKKWREKNVILIGDAKHAISPTLGLGCSLAMEDAFVLADEISKHSSADDVLRSFVKRRKRRVKEAQELERFVDMFLTFKSKKVTFVRNIAAFFIARRTITAALRKFFSAKV